MSPSPGRHEGSRQVLQSPESSRWLCLALGKDPASEQEKDALSRGPSRYAGVMRKGNFHGALPGGRTDTFQEGKGARGPGSQPHQSVLPILGFSPNPSPRSGEGHLTKASRCHTGKVSKYTPGGATRQEPLGLPSTERTVPPSPGTPAERTFLCARVGERSRGRGRGSRARGRCGKEQASPGHRQDTSASRVESSGAGSPALRVWGPGSLSLLLHLVPRGARSTRSMR